MCRIELVVLTQNREDVLTKRVEGGQTGDRIHGWCDGMSARIFSGVSIGNARGSSPLFDLPKRLVEHDTDRRGQVETADFAGRLRDGHRALGVPGQYLGR